MQTTISLFSPYERVCIEDEACYRLYFTKHFPVVFQVPSCNDVNISVKTTITPQIKPSPHTQTS